MRLGWLSATCQSRGPVATVVLDASHDTEDAERRAELRRRAVRAELAAQGAPDAVLDRVDAALTDAALTDAELADAEPPAGDAGRVLVVAEDAVLVDERSPGRPPVERTAWGPVAELLAVVGAVPEPVSTVVVRVDEEGGELLAPGDAQPEVVAGRTTPVHKARGGGWAHQSMQARVEETWRHNTQQVATLVDERVRAAHARLLVITGDPRSRARLRAALPERSARIADEVPHSGGESPTEVAQAVGGRVALLLDGERRAAFERYTELDGRQEGFAVTGLAAVVAAARAQAIDTLFVDPAGLADAEGATAWAGPEPALLALTRAELADLRVTDAQSVPAVSALIRAAVCADAELVVLDDPDVVLGRDPLDDGSADPAAALLGGGTLTDGLGAVLRFPIGPT